VFAGKLFVSADYCHLELRVLAHLAKDSALCSVLKSNCDVFRTIAASWNKVAQSDVSNSHFYICMIHTIMLRQCSGGCSRPTQLVSISI
jgi:hypothetical protein